MGMPPESPAVVITQHIPKVFSGPFAARLNRICPMAVAEAEDGQEIKPGHVYIAPGDKHLMVARSGGRWICRLDDGPPVNRHRPSVDVLFRSVASAAGPNALGIIMTGMGDDGARGLKDMADAGALTLAQDEASSVVYGMPKEAVRHGGVRQVVSLYELPAHISRYDD
jgi:two-component system chemotaxis response regulator CheB